MSFKDKFSRSPNKVLVMSTSQSSVKKFMAHVKESKIATGASSQILQGRLTCDDVQFKLYASLNKATALQKKGGASYPKTVWDSAKSTNLLCIQLVDLSDKEGRKKGIELLPKGFEQLKKIWCQRSKAYLDIFLFRDHGQRHIDVQPPIQFLMVGLTDGVKDAKLELKELENESKQAMNKSQKSFGETASFKTDVDIPGGLFKPHFMVINLNLAKTDLAPVASKLKQLRGLKVAFKPNIVRSKPTCCVIH